MGRRSRYRVQVATVEPLQVTLAVPGWPPVAGELKNATVGGMAVDLHGDMPVPTSPGSEVELTVWLVMRHRATVVKAEIVSVTPLEDGRRIGLRFVDPESVDRELAGEMGVVFNRRRTRRLQLSQFTPVKVLRENADPADAVYVGLRELSEAGVAVTMAPIDDGRLSGSTRFSVRLELDGCERPLDVACELRHRRFTGGRVTYGMRWLPEATAEFSAVQAELSRFLDERLGAEPA